VHFSLVLDSALWMAARRFRVTHRVLQPVIKLHNAFGELCFHSTIPDSVFAHAVAIQASKFLAFETHTRLSGSRWRVEPAAGCVQRSRELKTQGQMRASRPLPPLQHQKMPEL
jgi:hypothetical protein